MMARVDGDLVVVGQRTLRVMYSEPMSANVAMTAPVVWRDQEPEHAQGMARGYWRGIGKTAFQGYAR